MARKKLPVIIAAAALFTMGVQTLVSGDLRPSADKINDSSLIIGTYLIDFEALNEENQALAEKNAQEENQPKVYYKSELNSGVWYDITDAENVSDITLTNSRIVDYKVIDGLTLTLYFKADGTVVDLTDGSVVSMQDINGLFYPAEMSELSAVLKHREMAQNQADATADDDDETEKKHAIYAKEVSELNFLFKAISDETVSGMIEEMDSLDKVINSSDGSVKEAAVSLKVKKRGALDVYCMEKVCERIETIVSELKNHDPSAHDTLVSLLTDAESEINESITETAGEIGAEPTDSMGKKQQELQEKLLEAAQSGGNNEAEKAAKKLSVLEAMMNGTVTDSETAAELADEIFTDTMNGIETEISAVINGTHDYYKEGGSDMSAQAVLEQIQTDIADARQLAKDKAFYSTGSVSSSEYNKMLSEDLSSLGLMLSALSENSGSDELSRLVISETAESGDSVLSDAANAAALAKPATKEQKRIDDLKDRIDSAYGEYLDALNSGDDSGAEAVMEQVEALQEQLDRLRSEVAQNVSKLVKDMFSEMSSANPDKEKIREYSAQLSAEKGYLSEVDGALLEQALAAAEDMEAAVQSGSLSKSESAYDKLKYALQNVPDSLLDDSVKAEMLKYTASLIKGNGVPGGEDCVNILNSAKTGASEADKALLDKAIEAVKALDSQSAQDDSEALEEAYRQLEAALDELGAGVLDSSQKSDIMDFADYAMGNSGISGAGDFDGLLEDILKDVSAAEKGEFTPDTESADDAMNITDGSINDNLFEYKLVIPSLNIYSNTMTVEKSNTVFIDMMALAREAGLECFVSGNVYVFRGNDILIELTPDSNVTYVGDKLYIPSAEPYFSGDVLYVSADLAAKGLKLTAETENGTTFMR
ncbi:MAG: hypothetical protein ACI4J1_02825 [Ruminiclostridium sp.]